MIRALLASLALSLALPAAADEPLSGAEFEAYVTGKTLYFGLDGAAYGVERYLPGREVVWSFLDGACKEGRWYEAGEQICFVYEDNPVPQCWSFYRTGEGGLRAIFENDPARTSLYEARRNEDPMICPGPDVGV